MSELQYGDIEWGDVSAGMIVRCPDCGQRLYRLTRDVVFGQTVASASLFEPLDEMPGLVDGQMPETCPNGHNWFGYWQHRPWGTEA